MSSSTAASVGGRAPGIISRAVAQARQKRLNEDPLYRRLAGLPPLGGSLQGNRRRRQFSTPGMVRPGADKVTLGIA